MQYHHFVVVFGSDGIDDDSSKVLGPSSTSKTICE